MVRIKIWPASSVSSVTVQPGDNRVDFETFEILYDGKELMEALVVLWFRRCSEACRPEQKYLLQNYRGF